MGSLATRCHRSPYRGSAARQRLSTASCGEVMAGGGMQWESGSGEVMAGPEAGRQGGWAQRGHGTAMCRRRAALCLLSRGLLRFPLPFVPAGLHCSQTLQNCPPGSPPAAQRHHAAPQSATRPPTCLQHLQAWGAAPAIRSMSSRAMVGSHSNRPQLSYPDRPNKRTQDSPERQPAVHGLLSHSIHANH